MLSQFFLLTTDKLTPVVIIPHPVCCDVPDEPRRSESRIRSRARVSITIHSSGLLNDYGIHFCIDFYSLSPLELPRL